MVPPRVVPRMRGVGCANGVATLVGIAILIGGWEVIPTNWRIGLIVATCLNAGSSLYIRSLARKYLEGRIQ